MAPLLTTLFGYSWARTATVLGALASTMAVAAALFRYVARDAVQRSGTCATPLPDGAEVYCMMGVALARVADGLNIAAVALAGAAFWAVFQMWRKNPTGTGPRH